MSEVKQTVSVTIAEEDVPEFWRRYVKPGKADRSKMDSTDAAQQDALERLQENGKVMFAVLLLNSVAALAQILECWKIWNGGTK